MGHGKKRRQTAKESNCDAIAAIERLRNARIDNAPDQSATAPPSTTHIYTSHIFHNAPDPGDRSDSAFSVSASSSNMLYQPGVHGSNAVPDMGRGRSNTLQSPYLAHTV